ncbi:CBL-interacting protein kinase 20 [Diplonema papillatum]|nr:CBL-interacting protein kinase 20 [Diplonema papillatum]
MGCCNSTQPQPRGAAGKRPGVQEKAYPKKDAVAYPAKKPAAISNSSSAAGNDNNSNTASRATNSSNGTNNSGKNNSSSNGAEKGAKPEPLAPLGASTTSNGNSNTVNNSNRNNNDNTAAAAANNSNGSPLALFDIAVTSPLSPGCRNDAAGNAPPLCEPRASSVEAGKQPVLRSALHKGPVEPPPEGSPRRRAQISDNLATISPCGSQTTLTQVPEAESYGSGSDDERDDGREENISNRSVSSGELSEFDELDDTTNEPEDWVEPLHLEALRHMAQESGANEPDPSVPTSLDASRYTLIREVGRGQYGVVHKATQNIDQSLVAVKVINTRNLKKMGQDKLSKEVALMSLIRHVNVIRFIRLELDPVQYTIWMVMEYVDGEDLKRVIKRHKRGLPDMQARKYFSQIVAGVQAIHNKGVAHRDLKPENVMVSRRDVVKIADFGLSAIQKTDPETGKVLPEYRLTGRCGTPNFVAPEIVFPQDGGYNGFKSDVWSLGVMLYVMLTANLPFTGSSLQAVLKAVKEAAFTVPDHVVPKGVKLLKSMIEPDVSKRVSLRNLASHPWLRNSVLIPKAQGPKASPSQETLVAHSIAEWSNSILSNKMRDGEEEVVIVQSAA